MPNTKYKILIPLFLLLFSTKNVSAAPWDKPGWELTFQDEFDGPTIDMTKWNLRYNWGEVIINNELQAYVDDAFEFQNGILRIRADQRQATYGGQLMNYTSGVIASYNKFYQQYGWFEIKARMPYGRGLWPAFWLLRNDGSYPPEIDVQEFLGHDSTRVYFTHHWAANYPNDGGGYGGRAGGNYIGPNFTADFHIFAIEWNPQVIIWYVDGVERFRSVINVPFGNMYVIANLAVGGNWPGSPDTSTPFPNYYDIDYIRIYQKASATTPTPTSSPTIVPSPTPIPTHCSPLGDIDCSGKVNVLDLSALLGAFGSTTNTTADLDDSGRVNVIDLSILLGNFGK